MSNLFSCPADGVEAGGTGGRKAGRLASGTTFNRDMARRRMSREFESCPWGDAFAFQERLKIRLMNVSQSIHRRSHRHFDPLGWDVGLLDATLLARHPRRSYCKLAKAPSHLTGCAGHPII